MEGAGEGGGGQQEIMYSVFSLSLSSWEFLLPPPLPVGHERLFLAVVVWSGLTETPPPPPPPPPPFLSMTSPPVLLLAACNRPMWESHGWKEKRKKTNKGKSQSRTGLPLLSSCT